MEIKDEMKEIICFDEFKDTTKIKIEKGLRVGLGITFDRDNRQICHPAKSIYLPETEILYKFP
jgi:hypothetical protein